MSSANELIIPREVPNASDHFDPRMNLTLKDISALHPWLKNVPAVLVVVGDRKKSHEW